MSELSRILESSEEEKGRRILVDSERVQEGLVGQEFCRVAGKGILAPRRRVQRCVGWDRYKYGRRELLQSREGWRWSLHSGPRTDNGVIVYCVSLRTLHSS